MNLLEPANISSEKFVHALSRYRASTVVYYTMGNRKVITFNTYKKQIGTKIKDEDLFMVVPAGMEYRPDLVSRQAYGTVDFWWKILEANNIKDIFDFKAGTNIRIPGSVF